MPFQPAKDGDGEEYIPMDGRAMKEFRELLQMERLQFGQLLGYTGQDKNIHATVKRYENGNREIPPMVERLVLMLFWFHEEHGHLPDLDRCQRAPAAQKSEESA